MQCLFVDNTNRMVLAAMLDKVTRAFDMESKLPAIKYVGHEEVVRGIDYLPEKGLYITGTHWPPFKTYAFQILVFLVCNTNGRSA